MRGVLLLAAMLGVAAALPPVADVIAAGVKVQDHFIANTTDLQV